MNARTSRAKCASTTMSDEETIELDDLSDVDEDSDVGSDPIANTPTVDEDTNPQTLLFNELKNFAEGQANRIALHVRNGANVDYLYEDSGGRTPLHVLFDAFSASDVDDETKKRSCVESLQTLLDLGADPTIVSFYGWHPTTGSFCGWPLLFVAVMNFCPVDGLEILLSTPGVSVQCLEDALYGLLRYGRSYDMDYLRYLIDKVADLESTQEIPLDIIAAFGEDRARAFIDLVERKRPDLLREHLDSMLHRAVLSGTLATVKLLLRKGATLSGAKDKAGGEPLLFSAVKSNSLSMEKFSFLLDLKVDIKETDSKSRNILHIAAECGRMDVMKRAIELGVSPLDADNDGNLPIHMASYIKEGLGLPNASAHLKGLKYLIQHNSPVNAKNLSACKQIDILDHVDLVFRMWPSIKTLFWSLFGEFDLSSFEAEPPEEAVGLALFAVWLVLAVIVLLNMLIALISNAFQRIQDNADIEWKFARAVIIHDIRNSSPIPLPINIFHLMALFFSSLCPTKENPDVEEEESSYSDYDDIRDKIKEKIEEGKEEVVRRKDLKNLREHLDNQMNALKAGTHGSKPISCLEESEPEDYDSESRPPLHVSPARLSPKSEPAEFQAELVAASEGTKGSRPSSERRADGDDKAALVNTQSCLRRHVLLVRPAPAWETTEFEANLVEARESAKGSRQGSEQRTNDDEYEEKMVRSQLKSRSNASIVATGAKEETVAKEYFEELRQLQESFQKGFQRLQSEFQENLRKLQSEFIKRQAEVAGLRSVGSQ